MEVITLILESILNFFNSTVCAGLGDSCNSIDCCEDLVCYESTACISNNSLII